MVRLTLGGLVATVTFVAAVAWVHEGIGGAARAFSTAVRWWLT